MRNFRELESTAESEDSIICLWSPRLTLEVYVGWLDLNKHSKDFEKFSSEYNIAQVPEW